MAEPEFIFDQPVFPHCTFTPLNLPFAFVNKSLTNLSRHFIRGRTGIQRPQKKPSSKLREVLHHLKMRSLSVAVVLVLCVCSGALAVQVKVSISHSFGTMLTFFIFSNNVFGVFVSGCLCSVIYCLKGYLGIVVDCSVPVDKGFCGIKNAFLISYSV